MIGGLPSLVRRALYNGRLTGETLRRRRPRALVLAYHRVAHVAVDPSGQAVSPGTFERHLRVLRRHYPIQTLGALVDGLASRTYPDRATAVTFDDGYADTLTAAQPIAARLGVPLTVFVTVKPVLDRAPFWWDTLASLVFGGRAASPPIVLDLGPRGLFRLDDARDRRAAYAGLHAALKICSERERGAALDAIRAELPPPLEARNGGRPLTPSELQHLADLPGVQIGAHTMTHPVLRALSGTDQQWELDAARTELEALLGRPVPFLAYPFGKRADVSRTTRRLAAAAGYRAAFTTVPGPVLPGTGRHALPRLTVHEWPEDEFHRRLRRLLGERPA